MNLLLSFGLMLLCGFVVGNLFKKIGIPTVTGYIITGILFGESILGIQTHEHIKRLAPVTGLGLGVISLTIGEELLIEDLKKAGKSILSISLFQLLITFILVAGGLTLLGVQLPIALILGAIASANAPAETVAVIEEYRAQGPLTSRLLGTLAVGDLFAIMFFGGIMAIVGTLNTGASHSILSSLSEPMIEIIGSIIVGIIVAGILHYFAHHTKLEKDYLLVVLAVLFIDIELANYLHLSSLLINITAGFTLANLFDCRHEIKEVIEVIEVPLFIAFFTLAGAELDFSILSQVGIIGTTYIVARIIGKLLGAWLGAKASNSSRVISRYLGWGLIPQAGVGIGLSIVVSEKFPEIGSVITSIILASVAVNALIGPLAIKSALTKAGEVNEAKECEDYSLDEKADPIHV
ncbi:cation:proton antiporter [Selenihalanaerobacter shriftii]|uniref:Kef-type K+ transport system, membrane component KefB n=1 Tax=Selenihalanaerobacter shriftii TaxID=142842 RepID=A0A1T4LBC0_9FIRM|nr:cation:proton antiporter [Selenihalanaerobacter shriftii]SJZ51838.1 Kef-type K+ transport system, membrane component KefB [Selenihalanaerobacter shriftii]